MSELPFASLQILGGGRFSEVHRVEGPDGKPCALKIARRSPISAQDVTGGVFFAEGLGFHTGSVGSALVESNDVVRTELETLKKIENSAMPTVMQDGLHSGLAWYLMPFFEGSSWRPGIYADGSVNLDDFRRLLETLVQLDRSGQLKRHGDIKPDNLIKGPQSELRMIDPSSGFTQLNPIGQPSRLLLSSWYNPAFEMSDLPALGILLVEVLCRQHLWLAAEPQPNLPILGESLQNRLRAMKATGRAAYFERVRHLRSPAELGCPEEFETPALKCLGLVRTDDGFDACAPYENVAAFEAALAKIS